MIFFLLLRIPLTDTDYLDTDEDQKVSKHPDAWYYVHLTSELSFEELKKQMNVREGEFFPISSKVYSAFLSHEVASKLAQQQSFWVKKIPSRHKIAKSSTGFYSTLCPRSCKLPGRVVTRTDYYAILEFHGDVTVLAKTKCARMFSPYNNNIKLHSRFHRGLTHNFSYANDVDPDIPFVSKSRLNTQSYNGDDQCIAIIDTGVDNRSRWFERESLMYDAKLFTSYNIGDEIDEYDGHGTFVAGIAAGKAFCNEFASSFNGVAEEAKILVVDIKNQSSGRLTFPEDLLDLYEPCIQLKCPITLNAWTSDDPLMTTAIDIVAHTHPSLLMIFPSVANENGGIASPGDAKNVLSVGSLYGHPGSQAYVKTNTPITIFNHRTGEYTFGYTDSYGAPLLNSSSTKSELLINSIVGNKIGEIGLVTDKGQMLSHYSGPSAVLVFHLASLYTKVDFPVIRVPPHKKGDFKDGDTLKIFPSYTSDEGESSFTRPDKANGIYDKSISFYAKPEIVAPGGPMLGPKAGSDECGLGGLTVKEGPSVAAAVIAGDVAIIRQYLQNTSLVGVRHVHASAIRAVLALISHDIYKNREYGPFDGAGFGTPQLEDLFANNSKLFVFQNLKIPTNTRHDYCCIANESGEVRIALTWNDFPRDPRSREMLTQPLHLYVTTSYSPYCSFLPNIDPGDQPSLDYFNTVQVAKIKVTKGNKIKFSVTSGHFSYAKPVDFSIAIYGPVSVPPNMSCFKYYTSGNCPRQCEGRGSSCFDNKFCKCGYERGGDFCSIRARRTSIDSENTIELTKKYQWEFLKINDAKWDPGSKLVMDTSDVDFSKVNMYMNTGSIPGFKNFVCTETYCPWAKITNASFTFEYENWEFLTNKNFFIFGFVSKFSRPYKFNVRFNLKNN